MGQPRLTDEQRAERKEALRIAHRDRERKRRKTPEWKRWKKEYRFRAEIRAKARRRALWRILILERFLEGAEFEFPYLIGGHCEVEESAPQNLSDLVNGNRSIFVSHGNLTLAAAGAAYYAAMDDFEQAEFEERQQIRKVIEEFKAGKHREKFTIRKKTEEPRKPVEPLDLRKPDPVLPEPQVPFWIITRSELPGRTWLRIQCPVCNLEFWQPIKSPSSEGRQWFRCPNMHLLYV